MKLVTRETMAAEAADAWIATYPKMSLDSDKGRIAMQLKALGPAPTPEAVEKVIGNGLWTRLACLICSRERREVVRFQEDRPMDMFGICRDCLTAAQRLLPVAAAEETVKAVEPPVRGGTAALVEQLREICLSCVRAAENRCKPPGECVPACDSCRLKHAAADKIEWLQNVITVLTTDARWCGYTDNEMAVNVRLWRLPYCAGGIGETLIAVAEQAARELCCTKGTEHEKVSV